MNEQYAQLLMSWHHEALVRQAAHYKAADRSRRRHLYIGIPGIVIPTLVGASLLAASQSGFFPGLVFALATLCVVSAMASAMQTFLSGPIRKFFDAPYRSYKTEEDKDFAGNLIAHTRESINEIELRTTKVRYSGFLSSSLCPTVWST
jgi:hypothetical protein